MFEGLKGAQVGPSSFFCFRVFQFFLHFTPQFQFRKGNIFGLRVRTGIVDLLKMAHKNEKSHNELSIFGNFTIPLFECLGAYIGVLADDRKWM